MANVYCPECDAGVEMPTAMVAAGAAKVRCAQCGCRFQVFPGGTTVELGADSGGSSGPGALRQAQAEAEEKARCEEALRPQVGRDWTVPELGLELVWIEPGSFVMGSPESEEDRSPNETQQHVRLTQGYWLGKYAVTQGEYAAVTGERPSDFSGSDRLPVEDLRWNHADEFCESLNRKYGEHLPPGYRFRLPTEAQWEYACRAGTTTPFAFGRSLDGSQANFNGKRPYGGLAKSPWREKTMPVGSFAPNAWGLYDMHGNVWEWCEDWHGDYRGDEIDPRGPQTGSECVIRGGSFVNGGLHCRSATRASIMPWLRHPTCGFRLALSPSP